MSDVTQAARADLEARLAQYRPQIQRHILAMVRDADEAEELTQDTYARAFQGIHRLREPQAALAWLYRIATNVALDRLRRRTIPVDGASVCPEETELAAARERPASLIETALERSEMSDCVQSYLETLPDDYRVAMLLHDVYGLSNPEITFAVDERGVLVCEPRPSPPNTDR